jgi:5S rRNA maturation endonuclease (ribonuclease M5)
MNTRHEGPPDRLQSGGAFKSDQAPDIDFAGMIGPVARRIFGEPNRSISTQNQLRFGSHGSLAVEIGGDQRGAWFDHEANEGGGLLDLLRLKKGLVNGEAFRWLRTEFGSQVPEPTVASRNASRPAKRIVATYDYHTADGKFVFQVVRCEPKSFSQRRPDGAGKWIWNRRGIALVPYHLPALLAHRHGQVFVVEGEKDVEALERIGLTATCNPGGAAKAPEGDQPYKAKWPVSFADYFRAKDVVVIPDNDEAGRPHAEAVAANLHGTAARVRVLALPGLGTKGDVSDWLKAGGNREQLLALADAAPEYGTTTADEVRLREEGNSSPLSIGSDAEIARCVADDLEHRHGRILFTEGEFWRYGGTHWEPFPAETLWLAAYQYDGAHYSLPGGGKSVVRLGKSRVESIIACMKPVLARKDFFAEAALGINCMSGFIAFPEAGTPTLVPHSSKHRCRHVLPGHWPASPRQSGSAMLATLLDGCFKGDEDKAGKIDLLGELAGAAALGIATRLIAPKALVLLGEQAENGKSEVLNAVRALLPPEAVTSVSPTRFGDPTFICHLAGKLLNATDELASSSAISSEVFKQVITGEPVMARDVYRSATEFRPVAQHVFATNSLPEFKGGMDRGVQRRLLVLTFNRVIPRAERIEHIGMRIGKDEPDRLLDWAVWGAARLIASRRFTEPRSSTERLREWIGASNPVTAWLESDKVTCSGSGVSRETRTRDAFVSFKHWAMHEGYEERQLPALNGFTQQVVAAGKGITKKRDNKGPLFVGLGCH